MWQQPCAIQTSPAYVDEQSYAPVWQKGVTQESMAQPGSVKVEGNVWRLSRDAPGCRIVQDALDNATCDADRVALASEIRSHVWEALRCPHANFVLQKFIGV